MNTGANSRLVDHCKILVFKITTKKIMEDFRHKKEKNKYSILRINTGGKSKI